MGADSFTVREVMHYRLTEFLEFEQTRPVDRVIGLEKEYTDTITFGVNTVTCTAKIDRIDRMEDGTLLILDYKTGGTVYTPVSVKKMDAIDYTDRVSIKKGIRSFQLPLYLYFVRSEYADSVCDAALYHLKTLKLTYFSQKVEQFPFEGSHNYITRALEFIVSEILNPDVPFMPDTAHSKSCSHCPFRAFCS
jgi:ATP-dependent helicase/DNAse subunit B